MRDYESYESSYPEPSRKRRRRRFDDEPPRRAAADLADLDERHDADVDGPPTGDRWSTWDGAEHGPRPRPSWVVTEHAAVDTELGVIKTGKEADVHLVERAVPGTGRRALMAAKRYRSPEHRMFHRDAGYLEGRRVRRSRETRAMARRTAFGRDMLAGRWGGGGGGGGARRGRAPPRLWADGVAVPYPVQCSGTELLLEFLGTEDGTAAPRLAQLRPGGDELGDLWHQLGAALLGLARHGLTHGDLSAYNLLVHDDTLVLIDLPQVVDVIGNPRGPEYLARDVRRVGDWFLARGLAADRPEALLADLRAEMGMPPVPGT